MINGALCSLFTISFHSATLNSTLTWDLYSAPLANGTLKIIGIFSSAHNKNAESYLKRQLTAISNKYSLHPSVLTTFWLGLVAIRNDTPYPDVQEELPQPLRSVHRSQTRLGWDQLYYGRLSSDWEKAIDQLHPQLPLTGRQIAIQMVKAVWTYFLASWTLRNSHLHQDAGRLSIPDYQQAVMTLYEIGSQLPPDAREALLQRPLQTMLEQPPAVQRTWLERGHQYMKAQLKAAKTRAKLHTPDIRSFFKPQTQSANDLQPP